MNENIGKEPSGKKDSANGKKPYQPPSFRFESVFEISALSCGKIHATQSSCVHSRKAS